MKDNSKTIRIFAAVIIIVLGIIYFIYDPGTNMYFPKCPFMLLTGHPCPGCGSQRAVHSLLHLNIADAFRYNFVMVLMLPVIIMISVASILRERYPKFYHLTHNKYMAYGILAIIMIWWILRVILGI